MAIDLSTIVLSEKHFIRDRFAKKLEEYKARVEAFKTKNPESANSVFTNGDGSYYKLALVERLLGEGSVDPSVLRGILRKTHGNINEPRYYDAVFVVRDYNETRGKSLMGSTGF